MNKNILKPIVSILLVGALAVTGCASNGKEEPLKDGAKTEYQIWQEEKPEAIATDTGIPAGNLITSGIAGLYQKTLDLDEKFREKLSNSKTASALEGLREAQGEEAWKKAEANLTGEDKEEYAKFRKNTINESAVAVEYMVEATKLGIGIASFDVKQYLSNPFAIPAALSAIANATNQLASTKTALGFMIERSDSYKSMESEVGR